MSSDENQPDNLNEPGQLPDGSPQPRQEEPGTPDDVAAPAAAEAVPTPSEPPAPAEEPGASVDQEPAPEQISEMEQVSAPEQAAETEQPPIDAEPEPVVEETPAAAPTFRYDEKFYEPISADSPTGGEVEFYHFSEMDQELVWPSNDFGRPDPGQRPNFRAVRDKALGFLNGTKEIPATRDVRPLLALMLAEAGDKGPVGLARALDLFVSTAMSHWDALHPQKEDEDDDELMTRMEEMRKYFNPSIIGLAVESIGIARSPHVGDLTTRTFGIATTKLSPREGEFSPNSEALTKLLSEEEEARNSVAEAQAAYRFAIDRLNTFEGFLAEHPDVDPVDLAAVVEVLEKQVAFIDPFLSGSDGNAGATESGEGGLGAAEVTGGTGAAMPSAPISGPNTLPEAMELLDDVLQFYAQSGRSSPVPLGLIALRDLMTGDFNTWINQTASSGLSEAAINLSTVDASRLSTFASGDAPAAAAPVTVELDFSEIDGAIFEANTAFAELDNNLYQHQQTLPPAEGESENTVLAQEVIALRAALDKVVEAKRAMEAGPKAQPAESSITENALQGDARHSRITDRSGVKGSLDAVAAYFEREEPSSPAPAYLRRLKSLVDARFTEIARELMPDGGGEAKLRLEPKTNLR